MTIAKRSDALIERISALSKEQRAELLSRIVSDGRTAGLLPVPRRDLTLPVPLSPAQQDLWTFEKLYPGTAALNLCGIYHFDQPVDPDDLAAALTAVQNHHEVLRANVRESDDGPLLVFAPGPFRLAQMDLSEGIRSFADVVAQFRGRSSDLTKDRLFRGLFVRIDDRRSALLLGLHHIITDWWSFDIIHQDFATAYQAVVSGRTPELPPLRVDYADYASWQRELESAGALDAGLAFWRTYLRDLPGPLTVGGAVSDGDVRFDNAHVPYQFGPETTAAVREFARQRGLSVFSVLATAFAVLAHRLSGASDIVFGTPSANRSTRGLERMVGYVMNVVPIRWRIGPDDTFSSVLETFVKEFPELMARAEVPVGRIVSAVEPERVPHRSPLFQWVFMYLPDQESIRRLPGDARFERIHTGGEHDLVVGVRDLGETLHGSFEVRTDLYDPAAVEEWARSFVTLVAGLVGDPDRPVGGVDLLGDAERRRALAAGSGPASGRAAVSLADLVAARAADSPDAVAVEHADECLAYAELYRRTSRLARLLRDRGVGPESVVAVALPTSPDLMVALIAVQQAGGAFLPIDPEHPADRVRHLLGDAAPDLLLATGATAAGLPTTTTVPTFLLDTAVPAPSGGEEPEGLHVRTDPDAAAYVLHTSRSKGVLVTHRGIAGLAETLVDRFGLAPASRVLQLSSIGSDALVGELAAAFGAGATLVVPEGGALAGADLAAVLREKSISCAMIPPSVLATVPPGEFPDLRTLSVIGEQCPAGLIATWAPRCRLVNGYGSTGATVVVTVSEPLRAGGRPPLGRVVADSRVHLLDDRLRPVPAGVTGELYVAGPGLARGCLGRPAATSARFVADPYGPPGERMYRTGDLARRRADGQLEFLGRADDQVEVNGVRIMPAEVEHVLAAHPAVWQAVVVSREDPSRRLVAYVVPRAGAVVDPAELRKHAMNVLPRHSVPTAFVTLESLPVAEHGKLDRASLPAPEHDVAQTTHRAPETGTPDEELLRGLFEEVMGRPVGLHDEFFELGGDSITAIRLVGKARRAGLGITLHDVFVRGTPAELATAAPRLRVVAGQEAAGHDVADRGPVPRTPIMHWWLDNGGSLDTFTQSMLFVTPPGTTSERITGLVQHLLDRHDALRMSTSGDQGADLVTAPPGSLRAQPCVIRHDATHLDAAAVRALAKRTAADFALAPGDGRGLVRAVWYDAAGTAGVLLLIIHHLGVDGLSWRMLREEVESVLAGAGQADEPPAGTGFRQWALALADEANRAGRVAAELPFWTDTLRQDAVRLAPVELPPSPAQRLVTVELPAAITERALVEVPAHFGCRPDAVLLTAFAAAVLRWCGHGSAVLTDVEGHGRQDLPDGPDVSRTVGWFTSQYPQRLDLAAVPGGPEAFWNDESAPHRALDTIRAQLAAVPDRGLGYGLLRYLNPDTGPVLAELPQPQLRFNYFGRFAAQSPNATEFLGSAADPAFSSHRLSVDVIAEERPDGPHLVATWIWPDDTCDETTVRRLAALFTEALTRLTGPGGD